VIRKRKIKVKRSASTQGRKKKQYSKKIPEKNFFSLGKKRKESPTKMIRG